MEEKYCPRCDKTKPVSEFTKNRSAKNGLHGWCKLCTTAYSKAWQEAHPEYRRGYRGTKGWKKRMLHAAKTRAARSGTPFSITEDDIEIPELCPVLGLKLVMAEGRSQINSATLDRIEPAKGYVPGNVQVMSKLANMMKSNATPEQLLSFADWVYKTYESESS